MPGVKVLIFYKVFEEQNIKKNIKINTRFAVRAIIMKENKILLVRSNKGDYKFPGGGVEKNESNFEGLLREIREETGYINSIVKSKVGSVVERKIDDYNNNLLFQMTSHYYLCDLMNQEKITQQLDDYECVLEFTPQWVSLDDAILQNEHLITQINKNAWLKA